MMDSPSHHGFVALIGAGPGDPELLTLKAVRHLGLADVVLIDDLVNEAVLQHCKTGVRVVHVGKRGGCRSTPQDFITRLMVLEAKCGRRVARVKGGEPFVFGRGGEEVSVLRREGISHEVVHGITAGIAAPATIGVPVTHRDHTHGVAFVTGHSKAGDPTAPNWAALAQSGLTLVIYMGVANSEQICAALIRGGLAGNTPAAAVMGASTAQEKAVLSTLAKLPQAIVDGGIQSPAIMVIGDVVREADATALAQAGGRFDVHAL